MNKTIHKLPYAEKLAYRERRVKELKDRIRKANEDIYSKRIKEKVGRAIIKTLHIGMQHHATLLVGMKGEHKL